MASTNINLNGWFQTNTEGVSTIYLTIVDEGYTSKDGDSVLPNTSFRPRILSADTFSIRRRPMVWVWGDNSVQAAAFGKLEIDNYDGAFDFLLLADLRDSIVVFRLPDAAMFSGDYAGAPVVATCILDDVSMDEEDVVTVILKDTIAALDRPLPVFYNPPYFDEAAANRMCPLSFGACRNVTPLLIDQTGGGTGQPIYQLHDAAISNITAGRDMGALLDVHAAPPQYMPALNNSGVQLQVLPQGKLLFDFSSEGEQAAIPGVPDVLGGNGLLTNWPVSTNPPTGWTFMVGAPGGTYTRLGAANGYPQDYVMSMSSNVRFQPQSSSFGRWVRTATQVLLPGQTYRITIVVDRVYQSTQPLGSVGLYLTTSLTNNGGISSPTPYGSPFLYNASPFQASTFSFIYQAPNDGVSRYIYVVAVGDPGYASPVGVIWHGLKVELLGQYQDLPMLGINYQKYFNEIIVNRAGLPDTTYNAADLAAIDTATGYLFGNHYDDQPNILTALRDPLDNICGTLTTDALGTLRTRRLIDPTDPAGPAPVADFSPVSVARPISIYPDRARGLTTLAGARRNWALSGPSDFVTDYVAVPADMRARFSRPSQFQVVSTVTPAGQYNFAVGAGVFDTLLDDPTQCQLEIDRVVSIYAPKVYADGTVFNGKRRFVQFTVYFEDITKLGETIQIPAYNLLFGDIISFTYPRHGFNNTRMMVAGTELFPFAQKIIIWGFV